MNILDVMKFSDAIALVAFLLAVYAAFVGPKFQLSLHVMSIIAAKADEANSYWAKENDSNNKHITDTITSVIRTIQLINKIQSEHCARLIRTRKVFLTYFYLELSDAIHNKFMDSTKDPKTLTGELFPKQNDEGKKIICGQLTFIRDHFRTIHEYYKRDLQQISCFEARKNNK